MICLICGTKYNEPESGLKEVCSNCEQEMDAEHLDKDGDDINECYVPPKENK